MVKAKQKRARPRRRARILIGGFLGLLVVGLLADLVIFPLPVEKLTRDSAAFVYSREGYLLNCFASADRFWRKPVPLDQISPRLIESVIACEDRWFYFHPGVNPFSLAAAAVTNVRAGEVRRGGSTITMQIARMMEPKARTVSNKLIEIFRALQLERRYSKKELLEIYFNLVPYGGNIEGVAAATHFYFDKRPRELSWSEAAVLTAIPASPSYYRPDVDSSLCRDRRDLVLETLWKHGVITDDEYRTARQEEIPSQRQARPFAAPHFCQWMRDTYRDSTEIHTTLDFHIQSVCEKLAWQRHQQLKAQDIHNLSVVVLDNATGEILGLVGSPDFSDIAHSGQINGALAERSPGSTLKPFAFALAMKRGRISPSLKIRDIPIDYNGYSPENYDETYHGLVSVREALVQSYNVPAVNIASEIGIENLYGLLQNGGVTSLRRPCHWYGLPLVLGSCEVRLLELANLYATFARGGVYRPTVGHAGDSVTGEFKSLLSAESCFLISDILADLQRPDLPTSWEFTTDMPRIAWKTGTSYGRRDAWAIGYNPAYTVGVWAGNFSGRASVDIVGARTSAPLMFDIFNEIVTPEQMHWFEKPSGVSRRRVCGLSGRPPGEHCLETVEEYYIPGVSPAARCDIHRVILVDNNTGYRLNRECSRGHDYSEVVVARWPSEVASWLEANGMASVIPERDPACTGVMAGDNPVIISPDDGGTYLKVDHLPGEYQKILCQASASAGTSKIHWFVDGEFLASAATDEQVFYQPEKGHHTLLCLDDEGRSSEVRFVVK